MRLCTKPTIGSQGGGFTGLFVRELRVAPSLQFQSYRTVRAIAYPARRVEKELNRKKLVLDLFWLVLVLTVLIVGDYGRRVNLSDQQVTNTQARSMVRADNHLSQATMLLPIAGLVGRTL